LLTSTGENARPVVWSRAMSRKAQVERVTTETRVRVEIDLDGTGQYDVQTPIGFLTHMVEQLSRHGGIDLRVHVEGDVHIDGHHTTEDLALTLGKAVSDALGDKRGIRRYGSATLPMDEACVTCALDLSGRPFFVWAVPLPKARIGEFDTELAEVFFEGFARGSACNLHLRLHSGTNLHHIVEISFKALARALREAVEIDPRASGIPSTKGVLEE
jgi:imidazoleglycerol-phosphate dehydratase